MKALNPKLTFPSLIFLFGIFNICFSTVPLNSQKLNGNNISTYIWNVGIFNQRLSPYNYSGFEWPINSGKTAIFTSGITSAAYINGSFRMASCSYRGELAPGYVTRVNNLPIAITSGMFKIYKVDSHSPLDSHWLNWGLMVPFGAPFVDVNNNGIYEPFIDKPGVKDARQTIFICMTDGFPEEHKVGEGFGGGTSPMYSEVHLTAWCYDNPGYGDMQFLKWDIINKNVYPWNRAYFSIYSLCELGSPDNYMGSDSTSGLGYVYNADNIDDSTYYNNGYGLNPPAVGIISLNCVNNFLNVSSITTFYPSSSAPGPACEKEPNGEPLPAYNLMRGFKKDLTPWVVPNTNPPQITKYCYSGNPESQTGWTEYEGKIANCGGLLTGSYSFPNPPGERNFLINHGSDNTIINVNDTVRILFAQIIVRGDNHLNSVSKLKQLSDEARELCQNGFVIGINQISSEIPKTYILYQNYPNPFNPVTKIKFSIPKSEYVTIKIYDVIGREISTLISDRMAAGVYSVDWDASAFPSGIYFSQLKTQSFTQTNKMILLK